MAASACHTTLAAAGCEVLSSTKPFVSIRRDRQLFESSCAYATDSSSWWLPGMRFAAQMKRGRPGPQTHRWSFWMMARWSGCSSAWGCPRSVPLHRSVGSPERPQGGRHKPRKKPSRPRQGQRLADRPQSAPAGITQQQAPTRPRKAHEGPERPNKAPSSPAGQTGPERRAPAQGPKHCYQGILSGRKGKKHNKPTF